MSRSLLKQHLALVQGALPATRAQAKSQSQAMDQQKSKKKQKKSEAHTQQEEISYLGNVHLLLPCRVSVQ